MKIRNVEKFGKNQLLLNIYFVYFTCCRLLMNLSVKASVWYTLVVNSQKNTCTSGLLLFCGSKLSQVHVSLRPTITGAIHSSLEHSTSNVKHTIVVQALVPPSTPLPPQSSSILQPSTTHTQTSCKHTHTHTAQVITDLSSPVPRLCRWCSLVRANPTTNSFPSYWANGWRFLGGDPHPPTTSKAWWMATMPQPYFLIGPLSLLDSSTIHLNWSMSSSWRELCWQSSWLQSPPK